MKKILSIDGGGIRGIIPAQLLKWLEDILQRKLKSRGLPYDHARIVDYFDFVAGTSTGGILSCIYMCPQSSGSSVSRYSAEQAVNFYIEFGRTVFDKKDIQRIPILRDFWDEIYTHRKFEHLLDKFFQDIRLSELLRPCLITSYDVENRAAFFFTQHDAVQNDNYDFYVKDICRATSAAPTYFEAAQIPNLKKSKFTLIDGGVFANDPTLCAYSEVRGSKDSPKAESMYVLSLGTGTTKTPYRYKDVKDYGKLKWIRPIIDILMSSSSETTKYHMNRIFSSENCADNYVRIEPQSLGLANPEMDDASKENIEYLVRIGDDTARKNIQLLEKIADKLIDEKLKDPDPIVFEKL